MIETLLAGALLVTPVHDTQILKCGNITKAAKVNETTSPNGLLAERYDSNGDGKFDIVALSSITGSNPAGVGEVPHVPLPTFYIMDVDYDGQPDVVYVDKNGDGNCASIVLYQELNGNDPSIKPGQIGEAL